MKKTAYGFSYQGLFAGEVAAQPSPLEPGVFLLPKNATWEPPPAAAGKRARYVGGAWMLEAEPPAPVEPPPLSAAEIRAGEILSRLAAIDQEGARASREVAAALGTGKPAPVFSLNKLSALETEAATLRAELAGL